MHLQLSLRYPAAPAAVAALLADRSFVEELSEAGPATAVEVAVEGSPQGAFTVTTDRTFPTAGLPDAARRLLGDQLVVHQVDQWQAPGPDGARRGTTHLEVRGAPVTATASLELLPGTGASGEGSRQEVTGEVRAAVPLFGGRIEKAAEPALLDALRRQEALARRRLAHPLR